ncbi:MAG: 1-acyl-sn-glycerol-3-phosphate acyltransferase [Candidatus Omnitrophota bacterium]|nr:MAG: 1-acyl-sn-glycerol-3-phosphate acyltransferase [Candidatus Omnitrophota bacterium]
MIYWITVYVVYWLFKIFFSLKVKGLENIPSKGTFIIACNHASYLDPMVVGCSSRRKINFLAKEELFKNKFFSWYLKKLNVSPLKRYSSDSRALMGAIRKLRKGKGLVIFPEGTRSNDGSIREGKIGVSVLSFITKAPVTPCYVKGGYDIWPPNSHFFHKGKLAIFLGKPLGLSLVREGRKKEDYYEFAQKIMSHIKALKDKASYGYD